MISVVVLMIFPFLRLNQGGFGDPPHRLPSCVRAVRQQLVAVFSTVSASKQKTDVAEHPKVFHHVGLLVNEPPSPAGLLFN